MVEIRLIAYNCNYDLKFMPPGFLIIDDSYIDRLVASMLIKRTLDIADVHEVSGGEQGLEFLRSRNNTPQDKLIILLDIMMPQMNGFQFLEEFEKLDPFNKENIAIIMLSSTFDDHDIHRAKEHTRVKKLLSKPLSANELREFIL